MQKTDIFRLIGIIALVVVIGLLAGCNNGNNGGSPAPETVATPTATPASGTYTTAQTVTLSTATARAGMTDSKVMTASYAALVPNIFGINLSGDIHVAVNKYAQ